MNRTFADMLNSRLAELTSGLLFDYQPDNSTGSRPITITESMLADPSRDEPEGSEFPFVRWAIYRGSFDYRRPAPFKVVVDGAIWTAGNITDGTRDIQTLTVALGKITEKRGFPPYRLKTPIDFVTGNPARGHEGIQPHPWYYTRLYLEFLVPWHREE
ncbi:hypothetical protein DGMP_06600 [Desulfomarina profundi]|uniref:Uncharacterized protein n=1 Tax=Desulfomarina profundi TaxID=2772557 RepID=A0A8D5FE82_9BACT|nr:hypothetical protein [Desulfomarina profundi]BCL59967.1 hypothetical protein DGMP_06600 [Desulfomarina profundi]